LEPTPARRRPVIESAGSVNKKGHAMGVACPAPRRGDVPRPLRGTGGGGTRLTD
jgi:hypothetical protein